LSHEPNGEFDGIDPAYADSLTCIEPDAMLNLVSERLQESFRSSCASFGSTCFVSCGPGIRVELKANCSDVLMLCMCFGPRRAVSFIFEPTYIFNNYN